MLTERRLGSEGDLFPPSPDLGWAYFFDIDGTLAEIAHHPGSARIERTIRDLIERLYTQSGGAVAIITGRSIAEADGLVGIAGIPIAGQHGLERRDAGGILARHNFDVERFASACEEIEALAARDERIVPELKGLSIALHYRGAPELKGFVQSLIVRAAEQLGEEFTTLEGKMVMELKPAGKDKGIAITEFMNELPFRNRVPVFAGDDVTDEMGFKVVNASSGHSIKVGGGSTSARWRLRTVASVRDWLAQTLDGR